MIKPSVLQFKITLEGIKPVIWRQIQVPSRYTFWDLHVAIQDAMGWTDSHLHQFEVIHPTTGEKEYIGIPDDGFGEAIILPSWDSKVKDYLALKSNHRMVYLYDFGDDWKHTLVFEGEQEKQGAKYPICLAGARACPPEDVGGIPGYANFLAAIKNPQHAEHESYLIGVGKQYDPEKFDPKKVKFDSPRTRWKHTFAQNAELA